MLFSLVVAQKLQHAEESNDIEENARPVHLESGKHPLTYAVITSARNEDRYIGETLKCMASQTVPPVRWVVVSDGSTDGTDDIVQKYAGYYPWIELLKMPERAERHFARKVHDLIPVTPD